MRYLPALAAVGLLFASTYAHANPLALAAADSVSLAGAQAGAGAVAAPITTNVLSSSPSSDASADSGSSSDNNVTNDNRSKSTAVGAALSQAPTAVSGVCGKGNRFGFGVIEWTDFSSKCFNYELAILAAQQGHWEQANQWVERADGL